MLRKASAISASGLSKTIDRNLRVYSTAALAAGVSMVALAKPAQSEVVFTKKTIQVPENPSLPFALDLNHDGITDFYAYQWYSAYPFSDHALQIFPPSGGAGRLVADRHNYALALARGAKIGPAAHFSTVRRDVEFVNSNDDTYNHFYKRYLYGNWGGNPKNKYLGIKFLIKGQTHFGWIRMTVITDPRGLSTTITGWAYETVPNKAITAGSGAPAAIETTDTDDAQKPTAPSLGTLALGADGLAIWRRE